MLCAYINGVEVITKKGMEWIVLKFAADFNNDDALISSHFRCVCVCSFVCVCGGDALWGLSELEHTMVIIMPQLD